MARKVLLAIPAYRCEKQIARVIGELDERSIAGIERLVVIDNRSDDRTIAAALDAIDRAGLADRARVVRNTRNYGLGGSHKVAFSMAAGEGCDAVCIIHGDNQARSEEVGDLLEVFAANPGLAAVLGARFSRHLRLPGYSRTRIAGNIALNALYSLCYLRPTPDLGSGLNVFDVTRFDLNRVASFSDGFTFNMDLLLHIYTTKLPVRFVPITWREEDQISNARVFTVGWKVLKTLLAWRVGGRARSAPGDIGQYTWSVVER